LLICKHAKGDCFISFNGACQQLSNGWWVYLNLNADSIRQLCMSIVESAEIPEDEYEVQLW
jgi:hypothetical protein